MLPVKSPFWDTWDDPSTIVDLTASRPCREFLDRSLPISSRRERKRGRNVVTRFFRVRGRSKRFHEIRVEASRARLSAFANALPCNQCPTFRRFSRRRSPTTEHFLSRKDRLRTSRDIDAIEYPVLSRRRLASGEGKKGPIFETRSHECSNERERIRSACVPYVRACYCKFHCTDLRSSRWRLYLPICLPYFSLPPRILKGCLFNANVQFQRMRNTSVSSLEVERKFR